MMLIPLSSPIGPFPSEWHTRLKPPANHSQVSVARYLPPGPNGLGFSSASEVHLPTKYASFLCSGPGCGGPAGACAITAATPHNVKMRDRKSTRLNSSHGYISYAVFCLKKKNGRH